MKVPIKAIIILFAGLSPLVTLNAFAKHAKSDAVMTGDHLLSLHWLSLSNNYGIVNITRADNNGWQIIRGKQEGTISGQPAFLEINGQLKKSKTNTLTFKGIVRTQIPYKYEGKICERSGTFTFTQTSKHKYWRMHPLENCEGSVDYIDIYL